MFNATLALVYLATLALQLSWSGMDVAAYPYESIPKKRGSRRGGYDTPIIVSRLHQNARLIKRGDVAGSIGLGDNVDMLYTVPVVIGNHVIPLHLDTGSSDLWVVSDSCQTNACNGANVTRYPTSSASLIPTGVDIDMHYGDSATASYASGIVGRDTAIVAGIAITEQAFGLINNTTNPIVAADTAGIFGLSFPAASRIQQELVANNTIATHITTDDFIASTNKDGPLLSRITTTGALDLPMFTIEFQRDTFDVTGLGRLTVGKLPDGIDNSSLTWVPVRLYAENEGGMGPPSYAPNEVYPSRWEIDIDGVFLDGKRLPDSTIPADRVNSTRVSALIDSGNSLLRGPEDVVNKIGSLVSPSFNPKDPNSFPTLPCTSVHTLAFQIGGKMFPTDPRDFIDQIRPGDAVTCQDNLAITDPPSFGSLFRWSLGTPFFKSNLIAFHYGNLSHPSADSPRIGFLSTVPSNANQLLQNAVSKALSYNGHLPYLDEPAPTASVAINNPITVDIGYTSPPAPTTNTTLKPSTSQSFRLPVKFFCIYSCIPLLAILHSSLLSVF